MEHARAAPQSFSVIYFFRTKVRALFRASDPEADLFRVMKTDPDALGVLAPQKPGDVGYDLAASRDTIIPPYGNALTKVPIGVRLKLPEGYWGYVAGRSSAGVHKNLLVCPGVIDNGYTGEMFALVWNMGAHSQCVRKGERIAQIILLPIHLAPLRYVTALPGTARGETGFGSTS